MSNRCTRAISLPSMWPTPLGAQTCELVCPSLFLASLLFRPVDCFIFVSGRPLRRLWGVFCLTQRCAPKLEKGGAPAQVLSKLAPNKHARGRGRAAPAAEPVAATSVSVPSAAAAPAAGADSAPVTTGATESSTLAQEAMQMLMETAAKEASTLAAAARLKGDGIITSPELEELTVKSKARTASAKKRAFVHAN